MLKATAGAFFSAEGWLELEAHESDLRGSRGIAIAGGLMLFMGVLNFKNTVSLSAEPVAYCPLAFLFHSTLKLLCSDTDENITRIFLR